MNLRSAQTEEFLKEGVVNEFLMVDSIFAIAADSKPPTLFGSSDFIVTMRKQQPISLMIMVIILLQDKHTYVPPTMRSKKQPETYRSTW